MKDHFDAQGQLEIVLGKRTTEPHRKTETSAEMWKILESYTNSATSIKGRARLANHFDRLRITQGKTVSEYIGELTAIRDQLNGTDQEISNRTFKNNILKDLPPTYSTVKAILEYREIPPTTREVKEAIKSTE